MKKKDRLPEIIAVITIVIFLTFVFAITRPKEIQGGDIQHAIDTEQYR